MLDRSCAREIQLLTLDDRLYLWLDVYGNRKLAQMVFDVTDLIESHWFYMDAANLLLSGVTFDTLVGRPVSGAKALPVLAQDAVARATWDLRTNSLRVTIYPGHREPEVLCYLVSPDTSKAAPVLLSLDENGSKHYELKLEK